MKRLAATAICAAALSGCGIGSGGGGSSDDADRRSLTFTCLREEGVDARLAGDNSIQIGDAGSGPRVRFYLTGGEAEAAQFQGRQEGSEQIGRALLHVRRGSDELLEQIESCVVDP